MRLRMQQNIFYEFYLQVVFSKQWQIDEFDAASRRIIIDKKFRIVYRELGETILITRVYPTKRMRT